MAPPAHRRTGYSRKAQYGAFFGYIAGLLGVIAGGVLLVVSTFNPSAFAGVRAVAGDAAAPAGTAVAVTRGAGQGLFATIKGYVLAGSRDAHMERELRLARVRLVEAQALAAENRRLKALLRIAAQDPRPVASARLVAASGTSTRRFALIDAGAGAGVAVGMPVRAPLGLVGRVVEVGGASARVLLVTDADSLVPVRRASDGLPAIAEGRGDGTVQLRLINLGINPLRRGDVFVTSGSGGLYRPGTPVASVARLTRDGAVGTVLSDPAVSDYVLVEPVWSVPPPAPAAGPTSAAPAGEGASAPPAAAPSARAADVAG